MLLLSSGSLVNSSSSFFCLSLRSSSSALSRASFSARLSLLSLIYFLILSLPNIVNAIIVIMFDSTRHTREVIKVRPAPNLMFNSGVASEKMKMAMIKAE